MYTVFLTERCSEAPYVCIYIYILYVVVDLSLTVSLFLSLSFIKPSSEDGQILFGDMVLKPMDLSRYVDQDPWRIGGGFPSPG